LDAGRDLKRHGNVEERVRKAIRDYAADGIAHANNVAQLVGSDAKRMRVVDFRAIFEETADNITMSKVTPRGSAHDALSSRMSR
jgi:mRNA interferase RelE/StbE